MEVDSQTIPAPADCAYGSHEEAYHALKSHGIENGYGFRLKESLPPGASVKTRYYYCCDKAGSYQSKARIRNTASRATGCSFKLVLFQKDSQWILEVKNAYHNHPPSLNPMAHNIYRRRTQAQKDTIESMSQAGIAPKQIMTALRNQDPDILVAASDIRNERQMMRSQYLGDRMPVEALLDELSASPDWVFDVKKDSENHIQYLFFTHQKQIQLLQANPDILLMDCIYRINKYKLPLLYILGCTNL